MTHQGTPRCSINKCVLPVSPQSSYVIILDLTDESLEELCTAQYTAEDEVQQGADMEAQSPASDLPTLVLTEEYIQHLIKESSSPPSETEPTAKHIQCINVHPHPYLISEFSSDGNWLVTASEYVCSKRYR